MGTIEAARAGLGLPGSPGQLEFRQDLRLCGVASRQLSERPIMHKVVCPEWPIRWLMFVLVGCVVPAAGEEQVSSVWPYTTLEKPDVPPVQRGEWVANPIDAFVLAKQELHGLSPAPIVAPRVLLRRLYFDLVGLPPEPDEMEAFLSDSSPQAFEQVVERLLRDPRYGERWGRHWLDVVRYADTGGGGLDFPLPHMWRYRDYVIRAFNQHRPYDRFIREQIAGDVYGQFGSEGKIGAGFLRLGVFVEGTRAEMRRDLLNDIVGTTGSVFLGLSMECARCHDHKFDPIPTRDYYRLEAFFSAVTVRPEDVAFTQYEHPEELEKKAKAWEKQLADRKARHAALKQTFRARLTELYAGRLTAPQDLKDIAAPVSDGDVSREMRRGILFTQEEQERFAEMQREATGADNLPGRFQARAYSAADLIGASNTPDPNYPIAPATFVLESGDPKQQGAHVKPGYLTAVTGVERDVDLEGVQYSRRKILAEWIASKENPLTARVMVNRIWYYHFGTGLLTTPSDFGKNGGGTVQHELIDWLAWQFMANDWSIQAIHRLIVGSNTYRQSLHHPQAKAFEARDPEVLFLWRRKPIRLEAETIRDSVLAISGELNEEAGGPGFFPEIDDGLMKRASTWWQPSSPHQRNRRSVYMMQKRAMVHPMLKAFDGANLNESCSVRGVTTVTPQVFALFNSRFMHDKSTALASRLVREAGDEPRAQIERGYQLVLQRQPTDFEVSRSRTFLQRQSLAEFCLVLLNLNEFSYLE